VPDDADVGHAISRLKSRPPRPVCPGSPPEVFTPMGTPCASREFEAPALLQAPQRAWHLATGYWQHEPFIMVGDRMFSAACRHNHQSEGGVFALDARTGKTLWRDKRICGYETEATGTIDFAYRLFALPGQVLLVSVEGGTRLHLQLRFDMKTGKFLGETKSRLAWWNIEWWGEQMVSHAYAKGFVGYVAARGLDLGEPRWKFDEFTVGCPRNTSDEYCRSYNLSRMAYADGEVLISGARRDMPLQAHRQLHALDAKTGALLWRHTGQELIDRSQRGDKRGDDSSPMVSDGKVIVRVDGGMGTTTAFRALDLKTGQEMWTTPWLPVVFRDEWLPRTPGRRAVTRQDPVSHLLVGRWLLVHVAGGEARHAEVLAYSLADGKPAWRRPLTGASQDARLAASASGVVYLVGESELSALEAETGTRLWVMPLQTDIEAPGYLSLHGGAPAQNTAHHRLGEIDWRNNWMLGFDGGIYVASPFGLTKLR
jgi:outer membrane protein assembly factor BamB